MSDQRSSSPVFMVISVVAALATIGGLVFAVVKGVEGNPTLVGTLATALATVLAVVVGRERETRLQLRQKHREDIAPMYKELVDRLRHDSDPDEAQEFFQKWWTQLILDAPAEVIRAWLVWSHALSGFDPTKINPRVFAATENVLRSIRKDLGHSVAADA
jgi:hypothetical protein